MKFIGKSLYAIIIVLGLLWFFVTQLPLLLTAGTWPALFGLAVAALIAAVGLQCAYRFFNPINNKENA